MPILYQLRHSTGHNHTSDDDDAQGNIYLAKGTAMVVLFLCSFTLGCLPIKLSDWFEWKSTAKEHRYVKMFLGFGGGVLLCTTFIHLLPEVSESFEEVNLTPEIDIHYSELLMCTGFFIMYFIEECVHVYLKRRERLETIRRSLSIRRGDSLKLDAPTIIDFETHTHDHRHNHTAAVLSGHQEDGRRHNSTLSLVRGLLVVLALSIHELFEGLAVGLERSANSVWYMFGAIAIHKFVIAFCIGVELVTSGLRKLIIVVYVFTFAVVSPMGIGLGILVTYAEQNSFTVVSIFLQGLASGTLLYIVFFEILQSDKKSGLAQYFAILVGFGVMFGLTLIG